MARKKRKTAELFIKTENPGVAGLERKTQFKLDKKRRKKKKKELRNPHPGSNATVSRTFSPPGIRKKGLGHLII